MHRILFDGVENDWHNALPLGNGRMGAMLFRKGREIHVALNHYDCYYKALSCKGGNTFHDPARAVRTYEELCRIAQEARREKGFERTHYVRTLQGEAGKNPPPRPDYRGSSYPCAGEAVLRVSGEVDLFHSRLSLEIERGLIVWEAGSGDRAVRLEAFAAAREDGILMKLIQSRPGLWETALLPVPTGRGLGGVRTREELAEGQLLLHTELREEDGSFVYLSETALTAAMGDAEAAADGCLRLAGKKELALSAAVLPQEGAAAEQGRSLLAHRQGQERLNQRRWSAFWGSAVRLPDQFLETLWYLSLYMLDCCSGSGSGYPEQACGLSGLWDIRRPNVWGSMWYWDVNIQTVYQGLSAAGHPELLKVFCDGYLSYRDDIHAYTRRVYGREGWALDYPHPLYNCIQPWCARLLWDYYLYTRDTEFLREKAYPVFQEQIGFLKFLAREGEDGLLHIDPDISPEQGPVSGDSVITLACVRKLLRMGMEAARILERPDGEREEMRRMLERLAPYPTAEGHARLKDSALAGEELFLRHPSILMPVFPAGETGTDAGEPERRIALETLRYAANGTETGCFGFSWLACAAARLGEGDGALELLYGKGLDHILHSNGLGYEESERFINYCHIAKRANYLPAMCEASGGIVSAVGAMLLSAGEDGAVTVFPAIPEGGPGLLLPRYQYLEELQGAKACGRSRFAWKDVSFQGLLAPGGFEVSAAMEDGRVVFVRVVSRYGGTLKLYVPEGPAARDEKPAAGLPPEGPEEKPAAGLPPEGPEEKPAAGLSPEGADGGKKRGCRLLIKTMKPGETLCLGREASLPAGAGEAAGGGRTVGERTAGSAAAGGPLSRRSLETGRRIFLGEDRHTAFCKAWDSFTCPYFMGDERRQQMTPYIFDFTPSKRRKDYLDVYPRQELLVRKTPLAAAGPIGVGPAAFSPDRGYGFDATEGLETGERSGPDDIRRDFVRGGVRREFWIELPKGKYDLLVVSGDDEEPSRTAVGLPQNGLRLDGGVLPAGRYRCRVMPVFHERDGILRVSLDTESGMQWRLNAIIVNKEYALL